MWWLPDAVIAEPVPVVSLLVDGGGRISSSFFVDGAVDVRSAISVRRASAVMALATCPISWGPMTERKVDAAALRRPASSVGHGDDDGSFAGCVRDFLMYRGVSCTLAGMYCVPF
ncbi:unnamed protein product [Urochloa humidicola]